MNLTIDAGNTSTKIIVFDDTIPVYRNIAPKVDIRLLKQIYKQHDISNTLLSSVIKFPKAIQKFLNEKKDFGELNYRTNIPVKNKYKTAKTLGNDRLANAIAAAFLFPNENVLVIDAGTCIKYDFVNERNEYIGGSISPGLEMRFKALHHYTGQLPLLKPENNKNLTGTDTKSAMQSGVVNGMQEEIKGIISLYKKEYKNIKIILTGGDANIFAGRLNLSIFAAADLVNLGLNEIIRFHQRNKK